MIYDYDKEVDILTIRLRDNLREGEIVDSEEFLGGLVAEYGEDGYLIQLEIRDMIWPIQKVNSIFIST